LFARVTVVTGLLVAAFAGVCGGAGEQLIFEDFEKLNLQQLPAGWTLKSPGDFSLVDEPGHGKVLKISTKGGGWARLEITLDLAKVRDHNVRISALAKFPGNYTPIPEKTWAHPKILLTFKDKDGKENYAGCDLEPNKPDWKLVESHTKIDKEAQSVGLYLGVDLVAAEVFFDDFCVELDPDLKSAPGRTKPVAPTPATGGTTAPTPAAGGTVAPATAVTPADKAPRKTLEEGGALFGPDIATALHKLVKPGTSYVFASLGPGLPKPEFDGKQLEKWDKWSRLTLPSETGLIGPTATPRNLLGAVPTYIAGLKADQKPDVVFVIGEIAPKRKLTMLESLDWEDLGRVCLRLGAVPVMAVPAAPPAIKDGPVGMQDDVRTAMLKAASDLNCPVIDCNLKDPKQLPRLVKQMLMLIDKHILWRTPVEQPGGAQPGKKGEEIE